MRLGNGAVQLTKLLRVGEHTDPGGRRHKVGGDMTKVRYCKGLTLAASKLTAAVEHTSRRIEGTHETRRLMRWTLQSYRIVYGTCLFVTFSPNEKDSMLMIRLWEADIFRPCITAARRRAPPLGLDSHMGWQGQPEHRV